MAESRRDNAKKNSARAKRAVGVLTVPRTLKPKGTRLTTVNAPGQRKKTNTGRIHGLKVVNGPGSRRRTSGARPSIHAVNAPKGQW